MDKKSHSTLYWAYDYLSMLILKLNHVSKGVPGVQVNSNKTSWNILNEISSEAVCLNDYIVVKFDKSFGSIENHNYKKHIFSFRISSINKLTKHVVLKTSLGSNVLNGIDYFCKHEQAHCSIPHMENFSFRYWLYFIISGININFEPSPEAYVHLWIGS